MKFDLSKTQEELNDFIKIYEKATNSHDFDKVEPLVDNNATYRFTNDFYKGLNQIRKAFEATWKKIDKEKYRIKNIKWIVVSDTVAGCYYDFEWNGEVNGHKTSGKGNGTNILVKQGGKWFVRHEHLSN